MRPHDARKDSSPAPAACAVVFCIGKGIATDPSASCTDDSLHPCDDCQRGIRAGTARRGTRAALRFYEAARRQANRAQRSRCYLTGVIRYPERSGRGCASCRSAKAGHVREKTHLRPESVHFIPVSAYLIRVSAHFIGVSGLRTTDSMHPTADSGHLTVARAVRATDRKEARRGGLARLPRAGRKLRRASGWYSRNGSGRLSASFPQ